MAGRGTQQQQGMAGPQNGPPQQTMRNGGQLYNQPYQPYQPYGQPQQPPMWSSAAPTQPQFGNMGMMQNMQQPQMVQQPANNYNLTYNQPLTQQQPQATNSMDQSAQKPAMPDPVAPEPTKTAQSAASNITAPLTAAQNQVEQPPNMTNVTGPLTAAQNQVQNPVAPPPSAYTPAQASTPVNNVPRPEGTPDYTRTDDYRGAMGGIGGLVQNMQDEISPTNFNLSPRAPTMNQGQQNLVNMGLNPMIARLYGSRG